MKFKDEPRSTLSWVAYHLIGESFWNRYKSGELTQKELSVIINAAISHVSRIRESRKWYGFKWWYYDTIRLKRLNIVLKSIEQFKYRK